MSIFCFSTHVPAVESMRSQWWVYKMLFVVQFEVVLSTMETQDFSWIYITLDTTEHIKCALVSQVWPNCKTRCFFMFGLANRVLPTAWLPQSILDVMMVGSEPMVQPRVQMYSSWGDKCPFSVFPLMYRRLSLWGPSDEYIRCCSLCNLRLYYRLWRLRISVESILL
jgi:hypothetical protein